MSNRFQSLVVLACGIATAFVRPISAQTDDFRTYSPIGMSVSGFANQLESLVEKSDRAAEIVSDPTRNRVLVRGTESTHRIAQALQRSRKSSGAFTEPDASVLRSYSPNEGVNARRLSDSLKNRFREDKSVQVAYEPRSRRILVNAPHHRHEQVAAAIKRAPTDAVAQVQPQLRTKNPKPAAAGNNRSTSAETQLKNLTWQQLVGAIQGMSSTRLALQQLENTNDLIVDLPSKKGSVRFKINPDNGVVGVAGPAPVVQSWLQAIRSLDDPKQRSEQTKMVALNHTAPANVTRAVYLMQGQIGRRPPANNLLAQNDQDAANGPNNGAADGIAALQGGLIGQVEIGFVEGLDALIVRGNDEDVRKVLEIIKELEAISVETAPVIELFELKHVSSEAMADLVNELNTEPLAPRQGGVSITPLVKPNSLLLIGRPVAVEATIDLIKRLDQDVEPQSQFQIFQLEHIPAQTASELITTFFSEGDGGTQDAERAGLGTRVQVQPDFRSNAVVVYASPRDMREVEYLIKRIDVNQSKAVSEVQVFQLRNASATELATLINSTLQGSASGAASSGGSAGNQQQQAPGAPPSANQLGIGTPGSGGTSGGGAGTRSAMLTFKTIDRETREVLQSGILTDVRVNADTRTNSLVVTAPAESMGLIAALIRQLDQLPESEAQIDVFTIENGSAQILYTALQTLFGQTNTGSVQQQGGFQGGLFSTGSGDSSLVPLRFSYDQLSNSIIVAGSASDLNVVDMILTKLDAGEISERESRVYRLLNAPATDVANALTQLLQNDISFSTQVSLTSQVTIVPEPVSNSLLVSASPRYYDRIAELIADLDARPPMVFVKVLIAEVVLDNVEELGVELGIQDSLLFDRSVFSEASVLPGYLFNNAQLGNSGSARSLATREKTAGQAISSFGVGRSSGETGYGGLVLSAGSESISVLIRALQQTGRLDVLSAPEIMTLNNQPASVLVGQEVPFIGGTTTTGTGLVQNDIERLPVGLQLGVTPRISPDGMVVMEIDAVKSSLSDVGVPVSIDQNGNAIEQPIVDTTQASTTVSARSGQTVVLGGLITKSTAITSRRVPYLANVPVLGSLFRFDSELQRRTELLFIMTPYVVRKDEDVDWINQVESKRMSWCLADVANIYGDTGLASKCEPFGGPIESIYEPYPGENSVDYHGSERIISEEVLSEEIAPGDFPVETHESILDDGARMTPGPEPIETQANNRSESNAAVRDDVKIATWESIRERENRLKDVREELTLPPPVTSDADDDSTEGPFQSAKRIFSRLRGRKTEQITPSTIAPVQFVERVKPSESSNRDSKLWWR